MEQRGRKQQRLILSKREYLEAAIPCKVPTIEIESCKAAIWGPPKVVGQTGRTASLQELSYMGVWKKRTAKQ